MATKEPAKKKAAVQAEHEYPPYVLEGISELVFLDRYAVKDPDKNLEKGDVVVVLTKEDPKFPQKEVGIVRDIKGDEVTVELRSTGELFVQERKKIDRCLEHTPSQMWDRMAKAIVEVEDEEKRDELRREFRWLLEGFRFSPGGRINAMLGTGQNLTAYNCYVIPLRPNDPNYGRDSRQSIIDTLGNMVEIMSRGGGVGINLSTLRPRLAYVEGVNGRSSGSVSWGGLFSFATGLVEQGGSRRGALMLILDDWHPDVLEFIKAKRDMGAITNANISVAVSHKFMEAVEKDLQWDLVFPDTSDPDYDKLWDGNLRRWRDEYKKPVKVYQTVRARDMWNTIIESAWMSAEPGVVFLERMNEDSNSWYFEDLISTNPCITGETLVYTENGLFRADELWFSGKPVSVAVDARMDERAFVPASAVFATGIKPVYRLITKEGFELRLTADHRVLTERGWVEAHDLEPGDRIRVLNRGGGFGVEGSLELGRVLGGLVGHGAAEPDRAIVSSSGEEKGELVGLVGGAGNHVGANVLGRPAYPVSVIEVDGDEARVPSTRLLELAAEHGLREKRLHVPEAVFRGSRQMQAGFLQALFTASGHIETSNEGRGAIVLPSHSFQFLQDVQRLLLNFGIYSRIDGRPQGDATVLSDHDGAAHECSGDASGSLRVTGGSALIFAEEIGFLASDKQAKLEALVARYAEEPYEERFVATFTELVPDGEEMVYDLNVPGLHAFVANGLVVHNCGEQPLPGWGVCNLGHINLSRFAKGPIGKAEVDWEELRRAVRLGVRFLDNVIDITPYFFEENERVQKAERRIGMGTLGLGEMLIRLGLRYGDDECVAFIDKLYEFIATEAYLASVDLAKEKGAFPKFDAEKYLESGFMKRMPQHVREAVREHGIRNVTLLTQAPTGSTGTMIGTSTGIEPYYSWTYWRNSRLGMREVRERIVQEYFKENPELEPSLESLPPYFVTAMELTPKEHIRVQAAIQRWTDASISKTANAPNDYTIEQTRELYEYAYRAGCKGVTIYRDGSRDQQVLIAQTKDVDEGEREETAQAQAPAAPGQGNGSLGAATDAGTRRPMRKRPHKLTGATYEWPTPLGKAFITVNDYGDEPIEVFVTIGKAGSDVAAMSEALGRLTTLFLKYADIASAEEKVATLVKHLKDIGGSNSVGFGENRVSSVPDAVAKALSKHMEEKRADFKLTIQVRGFDLCPQCGLATLRKEEGCYNCTSCGYSKC
ncbi:MAG: ribonucleoside-diphosphate reductase [Firmicutes bacterium]|nr:ribonucleoside-diphosphate reductase [Bacillota bacterium]